MQTTTQPPLNPIRIVLGVIAAAFIAQMAPSASGQTAAGGGTNQAGYRLFGGYVVGASKLLPGTNGVQSPLEFSSSDARLVEGFNWAKRQALAYANDDGDPVGPWFEAGEPGRESFCMRDSAHQAMGAHALGLARFTHNMMHHFAENISESRDWCSYWGINRFNKPRPVDYKNDAEFWYNLPANFDDVDCCFRMYVWTADHSYVTDPVFLNFYDHSVSDYVERWALGIDEVMKRPRLLNVRGIFDPAKKFPKNRGIPGYNEQDHTYVLGFDVLAAQRAAYIAYANIQGTRYNAGLAQEYLAKAAAVENLLTNTWWDKTNQCFYARLNKDYRLEGQGPKTLDWHTVTQLDPDGIYQHLMNAAFGQNSRREYPETSFSWVGDLVNGLMGINPIFTSPLEASVKGNWMEVSLQTQSGLGTNVAWAEIRNLPLRGSLVTIRHEGTKRTIVTNQQGPAFVWQPTFGGGYPFLLVGGRPAKADIQTNANGRVTSSLRVAVGACNVMTVEVPE